MEALVKETVLLLSTGKVLIIHAKTVMELVTPVMEQEAVHVRAVSISPLFTFTHTEAAGSS